MFVFRRYIPHCARQVHWRVAADCWTMYNVSGVCQQWALWYVLVYIFLLSLRTTSHTVIAACNGMGNVQCELKTFSSAVIFLKSFPRLLSFI